MNLTKIKMKHLFGRLWTFAAVSLFMAFTSLNAKSIVLPVEAIDDTASMSAEEFNQKHQGIDVSGYYPDDPGYYVAYTHENLTYYFGPLDEYIEAINWKDKLAAVREEVIYKRPTLGSSEVVIYNFSLETIEEHGRNMKQEEEAGRNGSSRGEFGQMTGQSGQTGDLGQESGILLPQGQSGQQQGQNGQQQGQMGSQSGSGQQGSPIFQLPGSQQSQQSGQSGSSGSSSSSGGGSSGGGSSSSSGGGKPSWWQIIKGIFGG